MFLLSVGKPVGKLRKLKVDGVKDKFQQVEFNEKRVELYELMFLFWEQFLVGEFYDVAKADFLKELGEEITEEIEVVFDETLELLLDMGAIVVMDDETNEIANLIPERIKGFDRSLLTDSEDTIFNLVTKWKTIDKIRKDLEKVFDETEFYEILMLLLKKRAIYFPSSEEIEEKVDDKTE